MNLFERVIAKFAEKRASYPESCFPPFWIHRVEKDYCGTQLTTGNNREPIPTPAEPPVKQRVPVTVHAERTFTLSSGEVMRCCPADGCGWGTSYKDGWRKKHSRGEFVITEVETDDQPEVPEDDPTESTLDAPPIVAGVEIDDDEPESIYAEDADHGLEEVACDEA